MLQEEATHFQSENSILQQQLLQSSNIYVGDYIKNSNSRNFQSYSPSTCLFSKIERKEGLDFEIMVEERHLRVDQIQISHEYLHEHTKLFLEMDNERMRNIEISPNI